MANYNEKTFRKFMDMYHVEGQLITGKSNNGNGNVIAMNCGRYQFKGLSQFTKLNIELLIQAIACDGIEKAYQEHTYRNSVAKQKINEAHGRTNEERQSHENKQEMTYARLLDHRIQFVGNTLSNVYNELFMYEKDFQDWHTKDLSRYSTKTFIIDTPIKAWFKCLSWYHKNPIETGKELIKTGYMRILRGYPIPHKKLMAHTWAWAKLNKIECTEQQMIKAVNKFCELVGV